MMIQNKAELDERISQFLARKDEEMRPRIED